MIKENKGFTLVEVLVVIGISIFITTAIYGLLAAGGRSWLVGEASRTTRQEARLGLDKMTRELRLASLVNVSNDNREVKFDIPIDADGDGFLDIIPGTSLIVYGADDFGDFDGDGDLWERYWKIEYQIDAANEQIVRQVLNTTETVASQRIVAREINPDAALTYFQTETGGTGNTTEAVNIGLTTEINTIQGRPINPPIQMTLRAMVKLRN